MERTETMNFLKNKLDENKIEISDKSMNNFVIYMDNLIEWNKKINLTAIKKEEDIIVKHFVDSIFILKYINGNKIIDIGSGAGFPGIPLKIAKNNLDITLLDSVNKKVLFMQDSIEKMGLKNIVAIHGRAEDYAHNIKYREQYDVATSRAVANMSTLVEYMLPFVKIGGVCICMKGPNSNEEIINSKKAIFELGGEIREVKKYSIEGNDRCLVIIKKIKKTEQTYPRNQGKPLKSPLK